jgi:hypothetical protein
MTIVRYIDLEERGRHEYWVHIKNRNNVIIGYYSASAASFHIPFNTKTYRRGWIQLLLTANSCELRPMERGFRWMRNATLAQFMDASEEEMRYLFEEAT